MSGEESGYAPVPSFLLIVDANENFMFYNEAVLQTSGKSKIKLVNSII